MRGFAHSSKVGSKEFSWQEERLYFMMEMNNEGQNISSVSWSLARVRTGKLDPESTKCFIAQSMDLEDRREDLAFLEDSFCAYSDIV